MALLDEGCQRCICSIAVLCPTNSSSSLSMSEDADDEQIMSKQHGITDRVHHESWHSMLSDGARYVADTYLLAWMSLRSKCNRPSMEALLTTPCFCLMDFFPSSCSPNCSGFVNVNVREVCGRNHVQKVKMRQVKAYADERTANTVLASFVFRDDVHERTYVSIVAVVVFWSPLLDPCSQDRLSNTATRQLPSFFAGVLHAFLRRRLSQRSICRCRSLCSCPLFPDSSVPFTPPSPYSFAHPLT